MCVSFVFSIQHHQAITVLHGDFEAPWQFAHQRNCKWENQPRVIVIAFIEHWAFLIQIMNLTDGNCGVRFKCETSSHTNVLKLCSIYQVRFYGLPSADEPILSWASFCRATAPAKKYRSRSDTYYYWKKELGNCCASSIKRLIIHLPFNFSSSVKWVKVDVPRSVQVEIELTFLCYLLLTHNPLTWIILCGWNETIKTHAESHKSSGLIPSAENECATVNVNNGKNMY